MPVERFDEFVPKMAEILQRHRVNVLNVSIRHALPDPGSLLAWAREETLRLRRSTTSSARATNARERVAVWTRELIDAVLSVGGTYYLPYQPHATPEQFHRAYPRARELFALKRRARSRVPAAQRALGQVLRAHAAPPRRRLRRRRADVRVPRRLRRRALAGRVLPLPAERLPALSRGPLPHADQGGLRAHASDEAIYRYIQARPARDQAVRCPSSSTRCRRSPSRSSEMARQTLELLGGPARRSTATSRSARTGRYVSALRKQLRLTGPWCW